MFHIVKAGVRGIECVNFLTGGYVQITYDAIDYSMMTLEEIKKRSRTNNPEMSPNQIGMMAGQIFRFMQIKIGEPVITYNPETRFYHIGYVIGQHTYIQKEDEKSSMQLPIEWKYKVSRDVLPITIKNTLGAISTIFSINDEVGNYMINNQSRCEETVIEQRESNLLIQPEETIKDDMMQSAKELIQDKINKLDWFQMQELVAGLLRAMGYKTKVSPPGPDGGKDIVATKDGFGFEDPTIIVEVKHRKGAMGGPVVNQLAGVIRHGQKGLFVSTGGFTKQAIDIVKEKHHIVLLDLEQLTDLVIEYYEFFDLEGKKLLPLAKIYWPT